VLFGNGFAVRSTGHFGPKVPMNHTPQRPVTSESTGSVHGGSGNIVRMSDREALV
jgi:hypothetical protein